jgi:signal transduction histidine kinase
MIGSAVPRSEYVERRRGPESFERRLSALTSVAGVDASQDLTSFCADLTARVAGLVKAGKVLFSIVSNGMMVAQPGTHGFGPEILALAVPCSPEGSDFADQIVYHDMVFKGAITDDPEFNPYRDVLAIMQVQNSIAVGVKAGDQPLGLLAAFDSERPGGFTEEDIRLLRIAASAAGLLWRQKQISDARARLHEQAQTLNDSMRGMVNSMVHELRAPLTVIRGYADMIAEAGFGAIPIPMVKPLDTVRAKADEALSLVDDLLLSARLEAGAEESRPERIDLAELVASVAERESGKARLAGGEVLVEKPETAVQVVADPKHLSMILANLVRNAITYNRGTPSVRVSIKGDPEPLVVVADQGKGIPPELHERIFERFFRVQDRTSPPGTGLGLYISRQLARQAGGDLVLEWSEAGKGSAFGLHLPSASAA